MRIAVVTPSYRTPAPWLDQCCRSVLCQTVPCTHFLVNDGDDPGRFAGGDRMQVIHLPTSHGAGGCAPRAIGSIAAVWQGFDAIAYLDADNWFEPDHLETLVALHQRTGAVVGSSRRNLYGVDGALLGRCPEVDGEQFVDTSCLFLTAPAFGIVAAWHQMPRSLSALCDRFVWRAIKNAGLSRAHTGLPTVGFRTTYRLHYEYFGLQAPAEAKVVVWDAQQGIYRFALAPGAKR